MPSYPWSTTFFILLLIMSARYILLSGVMSWWMKRGVHRPLDGGLISREQILRDIRWSFLSSIIFSMIGVFIIELVQRGETKIYLQLSDFPLWYAPLSLVLYLFIQDTYFYWVHRLMHQFYFRKIHFAHHESRIPTAWTSFSFHPIEALIQAALFPFLVSFIPIHPLPLSVFLILMSLFGVTNHLGYEIYPRFLESRLFLITATHHQKHHQKMNHNFGLYFTWWDRWMGTEER